MEQLGHEAAAREELPAPGRIISSHQPALGEARVTCAREDELVVDRDAHDLPLLDGLLRVTA